MITREQIVCTDHYQAVMRAMTTRGLLLGSYDAVGKPNVMTIGWGGVASIWGEPLWLVLVRPSRYTFRCIEHTSCFTVNVPTDDMGMVCAQAGSRSGRDVNKAEELGLRMEKGESVLAPLVVDCPITYECQVVHSNDVLPRKLQDEILSGAYQDADYHRIYFGKILKASAVPDAEKLLAE
ncbi:MAG: flavin reductase family protein [Planctomycetota bacterium]